MKKIFIIMLFIVTLVRAPSVYADEDKAIEYWQDEKGTFQTGSASGSEHISYKLNDVLKKAGCYLDCAVHKDIWDYSLSSIFGYGLEDFYYCIWDNNGSTNYISLCLNPGDEHEVYYAPTSSEPNSRLKFCYKVDGKFVALPSVDIPIYCVGHYYDATNWYYCYRYSKQPSDSTGNASAFSDSSSILEANLPVYQYDRDKMDDDGYLDNFSESEPAYFPKNESDYIVDLEVPQELKLSGKYICNQSLFHINHDELEFTWKQTDENYIYWTTQIDYYTKNEYCKNGITHLLDSWVESDNFIFNNRFEVLCSNRKYKKDFYCTGVSAFVLSEGSRLLGGCSTDDFSARPTNVQFKVRNYYDDGKSIHVSNWLVVTYKPNNSGFIDFENPEYNIEEQAPSPDELDSGNSFNDDGTTKVGAADPNSSYDPDDTKDPTDNDADSDSLKSQIKTGFGLLGNNGLLKFYGDYFDYVPDWFFSLIATGISIIILIALVKLAL